MGRRRPGNGRARRRRRWRTVVLQLGAERTACQAGVQAPGAAVCAVAAASSRLVFRLPVIPSAACLCTRVPPYPCVSRNVFATHLEP